MKYILLTLLLFSSLAQAGLDALSFRGLDELVTNKYKSVEQLKAEKEAKLQNKLDTLGVTGVVVEQYATDTYKVQLSDGTTQEVRSANIDSPDGYFADNPAAQKKKLQQKYALNQITGTPVDQIQDSDLTAWKENVDAQSANQGFSAGSEITYIPTGTKSKLEGDDRLIADIYNKSNQNLGDLFDTPLTNAAYDAPWNAEKRRAEANRDILARNKRKAEFGESYKSGWDADGNAITVQQNDGWFTKGDVDGLTAAQVDYATRHEKSNKNNWRTPGSPANAAAGAFIMLFVIVVFIRFKDLISREKESLNIIKKSAKKRFDEPEDALMYKADSGLGKIAKRMNIQLQIRVINKVNKKIEKRILLSLKAELAREHKDISDYTDEEVQIMLSDKRERAIEKIKNKSLVGLLIALIIGI